jgi:uncharacterized Zn finger protein (UPF0148 family)
MKNINCEHCGALINVESDIKCPNCGAPYKNNKQYKEYLDYKKKQDDLDLESKKINNEIKKDVYKTTKKITAASAVMAIFIALFAIAIVSTIIYSIFKQTENNSARNDLNIINTNDDNNDNLQDILDNLKNNEEEKIVVSFNKTANTEKFNITVDKIIKYTEKNFSKKTYYGFHINFKNKTDDWKRLNDIKLVYIDNEGDEQTAKVGTVSTKTLDILATEKTTYKGYIYYSIPSYVKDVKIIYNNVTIKINNYKNKIK